MADPILGRKRCPFINALIASTACLFLAACETDIFSSDDSSATRAIQPIANPGYHVVKSGDTLTTIANHYGVSTGEIAAANDLRPPYSLTAGQFLILPRPSIHEVSRGENMYRISQRYGVSLEQLAAANNISPPYTIYPGQKLVLPGVPEPTAAAAPASVPMASLETVTTVPFIPAPTSSNASLPAAALAPAIEGAQAQDSAPRLTTPEPKKTANATAAPALPTVKSTATDIPAPTQPARQRSSDLPPPPPSLLSPSNENEIPVAALPPPLVKGGFVWPIRGDIISTYGPNPGGQHNDGINIGAPRGTPVVASQSGVVVYAGNEIESYGLLLIVKHADGWSTAYGHNDILLVKHGDRVARGEAIARVGSTGDVETPQLHFEIRRQTKAVNPFDHLVSRGPAATATRVAFRDARPDPE